MEQFSRKALTYWQFSNAVFFGIIRGLFLAHFLLNRNLEAKKIIEGKAALGEKEFHFLRCTTG